MATITNEDARDTDGKTENAGQLRARFEQQLAPRVRPLYQRALRTTRNDADAQDLLQDAWKGFAGFKLDTSLEAWLNRILTNAYISEYRKKQRQPQTYLTAELPDQQLAASARHTSRGLASAEDEALETLSDNWVRAAMREVPEPFRTTVYYADVDGRTYKEIAQIMNTPQGTVISRLHRGRRRLRDQPSGANAAGCLSVPPQAASLVAENQATKTAIERQQSDLAAPPDKHAGGNILAPGPSRPRDRFGLTPDAIG
jgi:RNA polymerase sigma-70 factor (ECF subfamily)